MLFSQGYLFSIKCCYHAINCLLGSCPHIFEDFFIRFEKKYASARGVLETFSPDHMKTLKRYTVPYFLE